MGPGERSGFCILLNWFDGEKHEPLFDYAMPLRRKTGIREQGSTEGRLETAGAYPLQEAPPILGSLLVATRFRFVLNERGHLGGSMATSSYSSVDAGWN